MSVSIFFCYAHEDEALLKQLKAHLIPLQRQRVIDLWHDRDISAGSEWEQEISQHLNAAQIILLLVSPDFMASDYCYGIEMKRALERHQCGEARVIPIILRHVYWQGVLGKLQALPTDARPVRSWSDQDEAFYNVIQGIRKIVDELGERSSPLTENSVESPKPSVPTSLANTSDSLRQQELVPSPFSTIEDQALINLPASASETSAITTEPIISQSVTASELSKDTTSPIRGHDIFSYHFPR